MSEPQDLAAQEIKAGFPAIKLICMKLSKLLAQSWLEGPEGEAGRQFKKDVVNMELKKALHKQGIDFKAEEWLKVEVDTDSYQGCIEFDESTTQEGLVFVWKLPFAPHPTDKEITQDEIETWVNTCEDWIEKKKYLEPEAVFPKPNNPYIPLATL